MSFSWQTVVSQFEIEYDSFCVKDQEVNIFFDYAGVNAEGSSPNTALRSSWTHLLLLDAVLAYTEHKTKTAEMTQSFAFQYHKILRKCIQTSKRELKMTRQIGLDDSFTVHIPIAWTSLSTLQTTLCRDDNTVNDMYEFLVSSPHLTEETALAQLITDMVKDVPLSDKALDPPSGSVLVSSGATNAAVSVPVSVSTASTSPGTLTPAFTAHSLPVGPDLLPVKHELGLPCQPTVKREIVTIEWSAIVQQISQKCEHFLSQGNNKVFSDICDVSTHCTPAHMHQWLDLLLLDALLCLLLHVVPKKRTATCFNQHRVLCQSIQAAVQQHLLSSAPLLPSSTSTHTQPLVTIHVSPPWENILNFRDQYSHSSVLDPAAAKKKLTKMSFKREQARCKVGKRLSECHVFQHLSLKAAVETVNTPQEAIIFPVKPHSSHVMSCHLMWWRCCAQSNIYIVFAIKRCGCLIVQW